MIVTLLLMPPLKKKPFAPTGGSGVGHKGVSYQKRAFFFALFLVLRTSRIVPLRGTMVPQRGTIMRFAHACMRFAHERGRSPLLVTFVVTILCFAQA